MLQDELGAEDEKWMREALAEAEAARELGEVPIGCVVVRAGEVIGRAHNLRETTHDPTAHAEVLALRQASQAMNSWRLVEATLYVTLEPCVMCSGALVLSRVPRVVFGAKDPKAGALETLYTLGSDARLNHRFQTVGGVLAEPCASALSDFFSGIRRRSRR